MKIVCGKTLPMKKSNLKKLSLKHETLKQLADDTLKLIEGGAPVKTHDLPCPIGTAKVDCG
jgi:hypothetical protein